MKKQIPTGNHRSAWAQYPIPLPVRMANVAQWMRADGYHASHLSLEADPDLVATLARPSTRCSRAASS